MQRVMFNQKGIAFIPLLFWIAISVLGTAVIAEKTGHNLSLNNSPVSEINSSNTDSLSQIVPSSSSSPAQDTEPLKVAPSTTPKVVKASDKALRLSTYIFTVIQGSQRSEFINKFSNGKNDLTLAINNLALLLDNKPEALALVEKTVTQDLARRLSKDSEDSSNTSNAIFDDLEYSNPAPNLGTNTYRSNTNTYDNSRPLTVTQAPLNQSDNSYHTYTPPSPTPTTAINVYGGADTYTKYGNTTYGSDGSTYTQYGNTVYGNDGSTYTKYGNTIYGNDGSTSTKYGNTTYGSDGTSYGQYGNTTYGSDGSSYTQYGNTIYTQPGY